MSATDEALDAAIAVRDRYAVALAKEEAVIDALVASAVATKSSLSDNYWQKRHALRARLSSAKLMVEIFKETSENC